MGSVPKFHLWVIWNLESISSNTHRFPRLDPCHPLTSQCSWRPQLLVHGEWQRTMPCINYHAAAARPGQLVICEVLTLRSLSLTFLWQGLRTPKELFIFPLKYFEAASQPLAALSVTPHTGELAQAAHAPMPTPSVSKSFSLYTWCLKTGTNIFLVLFIATKCGSSYQPVGTISKQAAVVGVKTASWSPSLSRDRCSPHNSFPSTNYPRGGLN